MGGGGSSTMKTNADPWAGAQPYLTGRDNPQTPERESNKGIFPEASRLYEENKFTPQMQAANTLYTNEIMRRATSPDMQFAVNGAGDIMRGAYDSNFGPVANAQFNNINAQQNNLLQARAAQGQLDPTRAISGLLSGKPNNPYLDDQAAAITGQLTRNMQENVLPGIRSEALASGQYGGSRQGIAEGLAASRLNQDLAPALTNLYGGAYENAQQRMMATAGSLNDQAFQNSALNTQLRQSTNQFNAANNMQNSQFNANLGLQNNAQSLQRNTQNLSNRMQGMNILGTTQNMQDANYAALMGGYQDPQTHSWQQLQNYNGMINPVVGSSTSQDMNKNRLAGGLGGALAGGMLGASMASAGTAAGGAASGAAAGAEAGSVFPGYGTAIGAVLGGLAGAFM